MRRTSGSGAWSGLARLATLGTCVAALAGCATGYSLVQPNGTRAGSYYTGESYPASGYAYDGDFGAYDPYDVAFGDYGIYGPSFTFGLGIGSPCGWGCAGYYGGWPWYYGTVDYHGWRHHHGHHHHGGTVVSAPSPRPWLGPDHPRVPPVNGMRGAAPPIAVPARPLESFANRRPLESTSFAPRHDIGRVPRPTGITERPAYMDLEADSAMDRSTPIRMAPSHDFAQPAARTAAPMRAAPPPSHGSHAGSDKIR